MKKVKQNQILVVIGAITTRLTSFFGLSNEEAIYCKLNSLSLVENAICGSLYPYRDNLVRVIRILNTLSLHLSLT